MSINDSPPLDDMTRDAIVRRIQKRVLDDSAEDIAALFTKYGFEAINHAFYVFVYEGSPRVAQPTSACVIGILVYDDAISHGAPEPTRANLLAVCERYFEGGKEFIAFSEGFDGEDFWHDEAYQDIYDKGVRVRRLAFGDCKEQP